VNIPFEILFNVIIGECYKRRNIIFLLFALISLSLLLTGTIWPKKFNSFTIIHVDGTNILQPLMAGAAEPTNAIDHVTNAREIIFGEIIMDQVLIDAGWLKNNPDDIEKEKIKNDIKLRTKVNGLGDNLLSISFLGSDPERAYMTAKRLGELFIEEGEKSKVEESQSAYEFIKKQVDEYLTKLTNVEDELRKFRTDNPDARPGLEAEVSERISDLQQHIQQTQLQLSETVTRKKSIEQQLSGEAAVTISQTRENQYRSRISEAQQQLDNLRLDYTETYPDIIRLKHQIEDMKESLNQEIERRQNAQAHSNNRNSIVDEGITLNPLYQELRSSLSTTETEIAALNERIIDLNKLLDSEYERASNIYGGQATLTKLTRNYQVNQEIYQDLLRRLENARVSKNLDEERQGLTFRIQEPAKIALLPTGLRFIHFAIAGMVLGVFIPLSLIYFLIQFDPRIRFSQIIVKDLGLPVLAEIYQITSDTEINNEKKNIMIIFIGVAVVLSIYGYVGWLKFIGQI